MTTAPLKILDFQTAREVPFVVPYFALPSGHDLCYYTFDHSKSIVDVNLYMPDPNKKYIVKVRGEEIDSNETLVDMFRYDHCNGCEYYFDTKTEQDEETDDSGNTIQVTREISSCCNAYRHGIDDTDECPEGHDLPEYRDDDSDSYEWSTETTNSSPMMFVLNITPPGKDFSYLKVNTSAAIAYATQVYSYDRTEYAWYTSPLWHGFNIYDGSLPSGICWGDFKNEPVSVHLEEIYNSYVNSIFNDDILDYEGYEDVISCMQEDATILDGLDPDHLSSDAYASELTALATSGDGSLMFATSSDTHIILSEKDEPAAGFIYLNRDVNNTLFNRMYVSGIPFKIKDPLTFNTVLLPIYRYEYINPSDDSQKIMGFITKPNRQGLAWFMANTSMTYRHVVHEQNSAPGINQSSYSYVSSNKLSNQYITVFGQIQL
jgi:hypothetical protein